MKQRIDWQMGNPAGVVNASTQGPACEREPLYQPSRVGAWPKDTTPLNTRSLD
jgi:hypothetical protein